MHPLQKQCPHFKCSILTFSSSVVLKHIGHSITFLILESLPLESLFAILKFNPFSFKASLKLESSLFLINCSINSSIVNPFSLFTSFLLELSSFSLILFFILLFDFSFFAVVFFASFKSSKKFAPILLNISGENSLWSSFEWVLFFIITLLLIIILLLFIFILLLFLFSLFLSFCFSDSLTLRSSPKIASKSKLSPKKLSLWFELFDLSLLFVVFCFLSCFSFNFWLLLLFLILWMFLKLW